jgi:nitrate reductase NapE component
VKGANITTGEEVAIKLEPSKTKHPQVRRNEIFLLLAAVVSLFPLASVRGR